MKAQELTHTIRHSKAIVSTILMLIYKSILELSYIAFFYQSYKYAGFRLDPNIIKYVISVIVLIVMLNKLRDERLAKKCMTVIFIFLYIPLISYFWIANIRFELLISTLVSFYCICFVIDMVRINPDSNVVKKSDQGINTKPISMLLFVIYVILGLSIFSLVGGIDIRALDLTNAYDLRNENSALFGNNALYGYIMHWVTFAFFPLYMSYSMANKSIIMCIICVLLQGLLYLCLGFKQIFLAIGLVALVYTAFKRKKPFDFIITVLIVCDILAVTALYFFKNNSLFVLLMYRLCYEPSKVAAWFFDFFANNARLMFSEGMIGRLFGVKSPYSMGITYVVSINYIGTPYNCNTGFISDAYAQGGLFCVFLVSIMLGFILLLIEFGTRRLNHAFTIASLSMILETLSDNSLQTILVTGGFFIVIAFLLLINNDKSISSFDTNKGRTEMITTEDVSNASNQQKSDPFVAQWEISRLKLRRQR